MTVHKIFCRFNHKECTSCSSGYCRPMYIIKGDVKFYGESVVEQALKDLEKLKEQ